MGVKKVRKSEKAVKSKSKRMQCMIYAIWHLIHIAMPGRFRTFGLSDFRTFGLSDFRTFGLSDFRTFGLSDFRTFGLSDFRTFGLSDFRTFGLSVFRTFRLSDSKIILPHHAFDRAGGWVVVLGVVLSVVK